MKKVFYFLLICLVCSSCSSTFFFTTVDSPSRYTEKVENGDFLTETDDLWIAYCFKGANGPIRITIFNKQNEPLYIDWARSALIIKDVAYTYAGEEFKFSSFKEGFSDVITQSRYRSGVYAKELGERGTFLSQNVGVVPPKSMISEIVTYLNPSFGQINKKGYKEDEMEIRNGKRVTVNKVDFTETNSPIRFNNYLTLYYKPDKPMSFENDFYVSSVIKTNKVDPSKLTDTALDRGDMFYLEKPANNDFWYGSLAIISGLGGFVITAILDPEGLNQ